MRRYRTAGNIGGELNLAVWRLGKWPSNLNPSNLSAIYACACEHIICTELLPNLNLPIFLFRPLGTKPPNLKIANISGYTVYHIYKPVFKLLNWWLNYCILFEEEKRGWEIGGMKKMGNVQFWGGLLYLVVGNLFVQFFQALGHVKWLDFRHDSYTPAWRVCGGEVCRCEGRYVRWSVWGGGVWEEGATKCVGGGCVESVWVDQKEECGKWE